MKTKELNQWLSQIDTLSNLQDVVYPDLHILKDETWNESHLGEATGNNNVSDLYNQLDMNEQAEVAKLIRIVEDTDLVDISSISTTELESRKGLALLQQTHKLIQALLDESTSKLRKFQSIRDLAVGEMERRSRVKVILSGNTEPLDPFTARFLFGPPPPSMLPPHGKNIVKKHFLLARVPSGKQVAVTSLNFDIPDAYNIWVKEHMKASNVYKNLNGYDYGDPPSNADQGLAQLYYKLGFKPSKSVTGYYTFRHWESTWNNGWHLNRSREFATNTLTPVD